MKLGSRSIFFLALLAFFSFLTSAQVVINEFEQNPLANQSEYVELYNLGGSSVDISQWRIYDGLASESLKHTVPNGTVLLSNQFYVVNVTGLNNGNEFVILRDNLNSTIDTTPTLAENNPSTNRTWSRVPDGTGSFVFQEGTPGFSNGGTSPPTNTTNTTFIPVTISSSTLDPLCVLETQNVTISAFINGSIQSVIFAKNTDGNWQNVSLSGNTPGTYSHKILSSEIEAGNLIIWQFIVLDQNGSMVFGPLENVNVNSKTYLSSVPSIPDGLNGWFVSSPAFFLTNPDASHIFYKWDSDQTHSYIGGFNLGTAPNNANITGGIIELNYWSDVCAASNGANETSQRQIINADFTNPVIINLVPQENEIVYSQSPMISAYIDEVYGGNSGINLSSVQFVLDGEMKSANVTSEGIDAQISYKTNNLAIGNHTVTVSATDNSGRFSSRSWNFTVNGLSDFVLTVFSPEETLYESKRVPVNLTVTREAAEISYINYNDRNPRLRRMCRNCEEYGNSRQRQITMLEGENNITFYAEGPLGEISEQNIVFLVDSKIPKITKTSPKKGFSSGIFEVEFIEDNPVEMILFVENNSASKNFTVNLSECSSTSVGKQSCEIGADLTEFEGSEIEYWFKLTDVLGNFAVSKPVKLAVDTTPPEVVSFGYQVDGRRITFLISIEEPNFEEIVYIDHNELSPRERRICTRLDDGVCQKKISFSRGSHNLDVFAFDEAGNGEIVVEGLEFFAQ